MSSLIPLILIQTFKSENLKNNDENFKRKIVQLHKLDYFAKKKYLG